jgi:hypothetical protein
MSDLQAAEMMALALAKAQELERLLQQLVELPEYREEGSLPDAALLALDDVLGYLTPMPGDGESPEAVQ